MQSRFADFMNTAPKSLDEGKLAEVRLALSKVYLDPNLPAEQAKEMTDLLDQLAGTVIYSREHYLERAYIAQQGDTIDKVARNYNVPWQLLAKINGLMPPSAPGAEESFKDRPLKLGTELKVVRGPFDAVVHLDKRELTLLVQGRYAAGSASALAAINPSSSGNTRSASRPSIRRTMGPTALPSAPAIRKIRSAARGSG